MVHDSYSGSFLPILHDLCRRYEELMENYTAPDEETEKNISAQVSFLIFFSDINKARLLSGYEE